MPGRRKPPIQGDVWNRWVGVRKVVNEQEEALKLEAGYLEAAAVQSEARGELGQPAVQHRGTVYRK